MGISESRRLVFAVFLLCLICNNHLSHGADTISANQSLSGDNTITSSGGIFELGFYKPSGNSSRHYISTWYKKISTQTIVWVANRETPVSDINSCELKILDGNLVLLNESKTQIWSTNLNSTASKSVVAVLQDDGNLVLKQESDSSTQPPLWQSFDHPAHTWLPGGKISYNKQTKTHQKLTSWKNSEDPASGLFSLALDADNKQYLIQWNGSEQYWTSGPWNGQIFSLVPEMRSNYIFNFSYIDNDNESYFTYSLYDSSITSRFIMDNSGQIKQVTWLEPTKQWNLFWSQPRQQCEVYAFCGAFGSCNNLKQPFCDCLDGFEPKSENDWNGLNDYSGGCKRKTQLQCVNPSTTNQAEDRFWEYPNVGLPEEAQSFALGSISECLSNCSRSCSCTAYSYEGKECSIWTSDLVNLVQPATDGDGKTLYLKLAASEFPNSKSKKGIIIGAVAGSVGTVLLLGLVFTILWKRQRRLRGTTKPVEGSLIAFAYRDLQNATKNFSEKLGGGGFGSVFKGTLSDSTVIAVKKLESISQGEKQFRSEVSTIGTIQHLNLVRLRGFCSEGNKKLLVYDYMPNGSLDTHLFRGKVLDWKTRSQIVLGTARGLVYLHEKCRDCIIHCDIKPENILLDSELCPKVADFGLAKLVGREFSRVLTTMRGTRGYLAPEWISGLAVTAKADVYSYGMMLFEIVSGRRNSEQSEGESKVRFFPTWAASVVVDGGDVLSLLDPRLNREANAEEVLRICRVACWCIQDDENNRPTMSQVVQILEGVLDVNVPPIPRSLQVFVENDENIVFFTESSSSQSSQPQSHGSSQASQTKSTTSSTSS